MAVLVNNINPGTVKCPSCNSVGINDERVAINKDIVTVYMYCKLCKLNYKVLFGWLENKSGHE